MRLRWISLGVLVAAGGLLALSWGAVPARWPIHWSIAGHPDGWATKSVAGAAGPLVIGFFVWLGLEGTASWMRGRGARAAAPGAPELLAVQATVVRAVGLAVAMLVAGLALALPLLRPRSPIPIGLGALADLGLVIGGAMVWAARRTRRLRAAGVALPDGYHGAFYKNPRDERLWVPKLAGLGVTINFAHRRAWPVMIALLAPVLIAVALVIVLALRGR